MLLLELGDLASVRACANAFLQSGEPLHGLINNAGLAGQRGVTASGFELAFGTNHVDNCVPNCASGHISTVRVQVSLSSPGFFRGHHTYRCYRVRPPNAYLSQRPCLH